MIRFLVNRPVSVIALFLGVLLLAILALRQLKISLLPDIAIPEVIILVDVPNESPAGVEQQVLSTLRSGLLSISGLEDMSSTASWGSGEIRLRFDYGLNMDKVFIELNELIDLSMNDLPPTVSRPRAVKTRATDLPVFYLSLAYHSGKEPGSLAELSEYARKVLRPRLEQLPEIAFLDMHGLTDQHLVIQSYPEVMASLGINQLDLQAAIESNNLVLGSITIKERAYQYQVRIGKPITQIADIRNTTFQVGDRLFKIDDVAEVSLEDQTSVSAFYENGRRAISLAVVKSPNASLKTLKQRLQTIQEQIMQEESRFQLRISRDQTTLLQATLWNLTSSLMLACVLAVGIVFLFYPRWQIPTLIGIVVPVSLLLSFLFFRLGDMSINMISLSGLLLGLGLMIDNGIIVLDNISLSWNQEQSLAQACVQGTNEMIRPLLTSMLTTCSIFFPLIFLSGITGALFLDQALAISISLLISYLVSIILLPVLYYVLMQNQNITFPQQNSALSRMLLNGYDRGFRIIFKHKKLSFVIIVLFLSLSAIIFQGLAKTRFPTLPERAFEAEIEWGAGLQPAVAAQRITTLFDSLDIYWQAHLGISQFLLNTTYQGSLNSASLYIELPPDGAASDIQNLLARELADRYETASITFSAERTAFELLFPSSHTGFSVRCYFPGVEDLDQSDVYQGLFNNIKSLPGVNDAKGMLYSPSYLIEPIPEKLIQYQVNYEILRAELSRLLNYYQLTEIRSFQYSLPVVIKSEDYSIDEINSTATILNQNGLPIPLRHLIRIRKTRSPQKYFASRKGPYLPLELVTDFPEQVEKKIMELTHQYPGVELEVYSNKQYNQGLRRELTIILGFSILLLYFLLTAQFESFLQPLVVLSEIPLGLAGSIVLLWIFEQSINIMSLTGMIVTVGVVINDSIVKIDTINRLRRQGMDSKSAIHMGGLKRINAITMTSLTTILASLPFLFGNDLGSMLQRPLAIGLIGGMIIGTLASLFMVPLLYDIVLSKKAFPPED
ncbi:efflux RND transporter permease subunit [Flavilitoribacter nigricans]|uniref:Acriflavin resistance protein n=1 Tax=Flavilitoribacter nigricans (strain ATCC 23147 / DSM 23189 / NBRC 102662 / NCIMB 1420 / SS-2) TaxID=1122177 RepID=A0A2D0MZF8_FLAN2|nr:efflux RND transporter permease subunit [Flavilitoribacter nigricans]PHN01279.1 hypothetical protein CRP01_38015 [Flavilitoribacter nigricans DSM 23189 = NBRC 102662]